jgi:PTS system mannose-specific IIB component
MYWVRIDNRLVHGQIIETWLPYLGSRVILVANDELANDVLRQEIIRLAVPTGIELLFAYVDGILSILRAEKQKVVLDDVLLLFASCADANRAHQAGLAFTSLNVGNLHYAPGKQQLCPHVAVSSEDIDSLRDLSRQGVRLDFRCVPNDSTQVRYAW